MDDRFGISSTRVRSAAGPSRARWMASSSRRGRRTARRSCRTGSIGLHDQATDARNRADGSFRLHAIPTRTTTTQLYRRGPATLERYSPFLGQGRNVPVPRGERMLCCRAGCRAGASQWRSSGPSVAVSDRLDARGVKRPRVAAELGARMGRGCLPATRLVGWTTTRRRRAPASSAAAR